MPRDTADDASNLKKDYRGRTLYAVTIAAIHTQPRCYKTTSHVVSQHPADHRHMQTHAAVKMQPLICQRNQSIQGSPLRRGDG
jgi:hypothetical protein